MEKTKMSFQIIQQLATIGRKASIFLILLLFCSSVLFGQVQPPQPTVAYLQILPLITFAIAIGTGILNLYIMGKLGKQREEILKIVRAEFKLEIDEVRKEMATKENISALRESLSLQFENLKLQIQLGSGHKS